MSVTQTGIEIIECAECGAKHPVSRAHCVFCGRASLFGHDFCEPS